MKATLVSLIAVAALVAGIGTGAAHAAGTASFSLSPNSGSHVQGNSFTVAVHENGDNVNTVNAKLTYDASKLSCNTIGGSAAFPSTVTASCSNGNITITRYVTPGDPGKNGDQVVGTINFTALVGSGSTTVSFAAGSQIASNGTNVWNGVTTGGTYSFTTPVVSTPPTPVPTSKPVNKTAVKNASTVAATQTNTTVATPTSAPATTDQAPSQTATQPVDAQAQAANFGRTIGWIVGGIGAALLIAGTALYWNARRAAAEAAAASAAKTKKAANKPATKKPTARKR